MDLEDAKRADLTNKEVWHAPTHAICCATAPPLHSPVAVYPDVVLGCYDPGEMPERVGER